MHPPLAIDGAKVFEWAWSDDAFGQIPYTDGSASETVHGFALCSYPNGPNIYRFSCYIEWECLQDQVYKDIEQAKNDIPVQYSTTGIIWNKTT